MTVVDSNWFLRKALINKKRKVSSLLIEFGPCIITRIIHSPIFSSSHIPLHPTIRQIKWKQITSGKPQIVRNTFGLTLKTSKKSK